MRNRTQSLDAKRQSARLRSTALHPKKARLRRAAGRARSLSWAENNGFLAPWWLVVTPETPGNGG